MGIGGWALMRSRIAQHALPTVNAKQRIG